RIERGQGVLWDEGRTFADEMTARAFGHPPGVLAGEHHPALDDLDRWRQDAEDGAGDHALAGARFTDERMHLTRVNGERDGAQQAAATAQSDTEIVDFEIRGCHLSTGSKRSFRPSPNWLKARTVRNRAIIGNTSTHQA